MKANVAGLVLAGGRSSRFTGGAKEEALLAGRSLIDHVIARAAPQVRTLAISRTQEGSDNRDLPVVLDLYPELGPLAGLQAGLLWAASIAPKVTHIATFPCDAPLFPEDLVERLLAAAPPGAAAVPISGGTLHPALGLWPLRLAADAEKRLASQDRSLRAFARTAGAVSVEFTDPCGFVNINTASDLVRAEAALAKAERRR